VWFFIRCWGSTDAVRKLYLAPRIAAHAAPPLPNLPLRYADDGAHCGHDDVVLALLAGPRWRPASCRMSGIQARAWRRWRVALGPTARRDADEVSGDRRELRQTGNDMTSWSPREGKNVVAIVVDIRFSSEFWMSWPPAGHRSTPTSRSSRRWNALSFHTRSTRGAWRTSSPATGGLSSSMEIQTDQSYGGLWAGWVRAMRLIRSGFCVISGHRDHRAASHLGSTTVP